jgi:hypothetical protein
MKDEIIIKVTIERLGETNIGRINNLIKGLVFDLQKEKDLDVLDYTQIQSKFIGTKNG